LTTRTTRSRGPHRRNFAAALRRPPAMFGWALAAFLALDAGVAGADPGPAPTLVENVCQACHGADGNSVSPIFPNLAGLQPEYIELELNEFISGKRKNDMMAPIVAGMKAEEIAAVAAYFSRRKMASDGVRDKDLADQGKRVFFDGNEDTGVPACAGCHQPDGLGRATGGPDTARFPRLASQHADYVSVQLHNFKDGARADDPARIMRSVAGRLTNEEIAAVAEFVASMQAPQQ
jgi:cytochrome c553